MLNIEKKSSMKEERSIAFIKQYFQWAFKCNKDMITKELIWLLNVGLCTTDELWRLSQCRFQISNVVSYKSNERWEMMRVMQVLEEKIYYSAWLKWWKMEDDVCDL